ncbi:MAG: hypothetical protein WD509_00895 [Candidatus Paceibacterota bacterium]
MFVLKKTKRMFPFVRTAVILIIVLSAIFYFLPHIQPSKDYVVEFRASGFYPSELTVRTGDRVTFKAVDDVFWPASDPHPTHENLGGFDAGKVLEIGDQWTYVFDTPGVWRYHDHLSAYFEGKVTVLNRSSVISGTTDSIDSTCDGICFDERIRETVKEKGVDAAYALFQEAFAAGTLPRSCHWTAHQIGEEAYDLFKDGKKFPITEATTYCGYGFYHGFLEGLLRENPDVDYVLSFCKEVEAQLGDMGLQNCYHGIGHGYTEDPPDSRVWGDFEAMLKPGVKVCEFLFKDSFRNLNLCLTGVFTVPAGFAADGEFGLSIDPDDPFTFCRTQPYRYQKACYGEFAPKLDVILDWDLSRLPQYVDSIPDEKVRHLIVWVVPSVMMARDILADSHTNYILGCRENFTGKLQEICFGGTIFGFFSHGIPRLEYKKALEFCGSDALLSRERELCYSESLRHIRIRHSEDEVAHICKIVPNQYANYCTGEIKESPYNDPDFER